LKKKKTIARKRLAEFEAMNCDPNSFENPVDNAKSFFQKDATKSLDHGDDKNVFIYRDDSFAEIALTEGGRIQIRVFDCPEQSDPTVATVATETEKDG
jgi:hypothetical protein